MKPIIWLIILVLFGIGEAVTVGLTSIWFALGALGALIVSQLGLASGPRSSPSSSSPPCPCCWSAPSPRSSCGPATPHQRRPGHWCHRPGHGGDRQPGRSRLVNIAGQVWSARSAGEGAVIPAGQEVRVTQIQGVKVLVEPVQSGGPEH